MIQYYNWGELKYAISVRARSVPVSAVNTGFTRVLLFMVDGITSITAIEHIAAGNFCELSLGPVIHVWGRLPT